MFLPLAGGATGKLDVSWILGITELSGGRHILSHNNWPVYIAQCVLNSILDLATKSLSMSAMSVLCISAFIVFISSLIDSIGFYGVARLIIVL